MDQSKDTAADPVSAAIDLALHLGVRDMGSMTTVWETQIDDAWWLAINPMTEDATTSKGDRVPPFSMYVEFNGWPAGVVSFVNGGEFAAGSAANAETFVAAVAARMARS